MNNSFSISPKKTITLQYHPKKRITSQYPLSLLFKSAVSLKLSENSQKVAFYCRFHICQLPWYSNVIVFCCFFWGDTEGVILFLLTTSVILRCYRFFVFFFICSFLKDADMLTFFVDGKHKDHDFWGFFSGNKSLKGLFSVASKKRKQLLLLTSIYIQKLRRKKNSAVSKKPRLILKHQKSWKKPHKSCHFTIYCEDFFLQTQQYPKKNSDTGKTFFFFGSDHCFFLFFFTSSKPGTERSGGEAVVERSGGFGAVGKNKRKKLWSLPKKKKVLPVITLFFGYSWVAKKNFTVCM